MPSTPPHHPHSRLNNNIFNRYKKALEEDDVDIFTKSIDPRLNPAEDDAKDIFAKFRKSRQARSDNFEVIFDFPFKFENIGGYEDVKAELQQCVDLLANHQKYSKYNLRIPKGLIFEGPPGNGKTLFAKALAGEAKTGFIVVSGSEFNEKYVGVGASKVRELFQLAKDNVPCIIFIDEIDSVGRRKSGDGEFSTAEKDTTLNELLVALDGFKNHTGIFVVGATNRYDLLDPALLRPGRIDKHIFIGLPNADTRRKVISIHIEGKPYNSREFSQEDLVHMTEGLSCAQIENLLNEALLYALLQNRERIEKSDIDVSLNRMLFGWMNQPHMFDDVMLTRITVHEMGHVICGLLAKHYSPVSKVVLNLYAPKCPAYTLFQKEGSDGALSTKNALKEYLTILVAGRVAEECFFDTSITTGAINDFEKAHEVANQMVTYYGMGSKIIYPQRSESYKTTIDNEVSFILEEAYAAAKKIIYEHKGFIVVGAELLKKKGVIEREELCSVFESFLKEK